MKRCPQCGAEYDDYVQYCFVDGVELADAAAVPAPAAPAAPPVPAPAPAPVPAEAARPKPPPAHLPPPARTPRPAPAVEPTQRGLPVWALLMMLMMLLTAFGLVGLAGILLVVGGSPGAPPAPAPVVQAPAPPPPPVPSSPTPRPSANTLKMSFDSNPTGASVFEGAREICPATPCTIEQKEYAPGSRTFTVKLDGYQDLDVEVTDFTRPTVVDLVSLNRRTNRPGGGRSDDTILDAR